MTHTVQHCLKRNVARQLRARCMHVLHIFACKVTSSVLDCTQLRIWLCVWQVMKHSTIYRHLQNQKITNRIHLERTMPLVNLQNHHILSLSVWHPFPPSSIGLSLQLVATPNYPVAAGQRVDLQCITFTTPYSNTWSWQRQENEMWIEVDGKGSLTLTKPEQSGLYRCQDKGQNTSSPTHSVIIVAMPISGW